MKRGKELIYDILVLNPLSNFSEYATYIEKNLEQEAKKYEKQLAEFDHEEVTEEWEKEFEDMVESVLDDMTPFTHYFPEIMRSSLLISVYAFFEEKLISTCKGEKNSLQFSNIRGNSTIERAQIYIEKVMKIDFPSNNKHWKFLRNVNKIRNCFVHNGGKINKDKSERLNNIIEDMDNIHVNERGKIVIEKDFIEGMIMHVDSFLSMLYLETDILAKRK